MKPLVCAHRGDSAYHPPNTWQAFAGAKQAGAEMCEADVQMTQDGVLVVHHDYALGGRRIREMPFAEFARHAPQHPPVAELVDWARRAGMYLLLEIKDMDAAMPLARLLPPEAADFIVVGSFHAGALAAFRAARPDVPISLMLGTVLDAATSIALARKLGCAWLHPCWEARDPWPHRLLDGFADEAKRAGLRLMIWHEEREDELDKLLGHEPDAICTNDPALLVRLRKMR